MRGLDCRFERDKERRIHAASFGWGPSPVPSRMSCQPCADLQVLVGGVVDNDQLRAEIAGHRRFDGTQEAERLLMSLAVPALRQYLAGQHVQDREQYRFPVPLVVVGRSPDAAEARRQQR